MFSTHENPRYSPITPWRYLTDAELATLRPYFQAGGPGRPIFDLRARLDAIFGVICQNGPWRNLPEEMGPADTAHRQFRRWVHRGVWTTLLKAVADPSCPPALKRFEHWICRAYRRALRILKMPGLALANRLGLLSALPAPWWMLPKPELSETWRALMIRMTKHAMELPIAELPPWLQALKGMHRFLGGAARIPRSLAPP